MNNPFIKITWEDVPENFTPERIKRIKSYFSEKYNAKTIQIVTKNLTSNKDTKLKSLDVSDNILDPLYQKTLMKEFIKENNIEIKLDLIDRLDNKVNQEILKATHNKIRYNKWYIKQIEFSNFLSFGENNVIDFTQLNGITVIESNPKNFGGKSTSTVDLLMFLFFNSTTKTKTTGEIFNKYTNKDEFIVRGLIVIDEQKYVIERKSIRKKSKLGEYSYTNKLEFYRILDDTTIENLTGEQRKETETFITSVIGSEEDFLSTILTTGSNLEELIESKPTARGQILTKFIGLENLKLKEEVCREIYNDWSKKLISNNYNITQLELDNTTYSETINNSIKDIEKLENELNKLDKDLNNLEKRKEEILTSKNNDIDQELIKTNPTLLKKEIDVLLGEIKSTQLKLKDVDLKEPSKYFIEDEYKTLKELLGDLYSFDVAYKYEKEEKDKLIKQLTEAKICPTCNRPLEEDDHTEEIEKLKKELKEIENNSKSNKKEFDKIKKKLDNLDLLKIEFETYEKNKLKIARYELEIEQKDLEIKQKQSKLNNYENNKKKLEENQKIDGELISLRTKIDTAKADIKQKNILIEKLKNGIENFKEKINVNIELIKKIKIEDETLQVFKVYLTIYGKNGISKVILKNMIPLLNLELHRLLMDSCHFSLELNINDKNEVEFMMIDTESRVVKSLNTGSGYERTISSLALRSVLTKVSPLPKPNIVVMDEVFGKIADENLEMVGEFFKKIKNYFEHIFVISHNPLIRNWSDNLIMIKKEDNISSIDFITTKIS